MAHLHASIPFLLLLACAACGGTDATVPSATSVAAPAVEAAVSPSAPSPSGFEAWKARHAVEGTSAEGTVKVWLDATLLWANGDEADRALAVEVIQYLTIPLKDEPDWPKRPTNQTFVQQMEEKPYIFRSYAVGATPENEYAMDPADWKLNVRRIEAPADDRGTRVEIISGGADSPRPIYMKQSEQTGLWYVNVWANTYVGIRKPIPPGTETFR
ncbi:MAG: hypothetical protein JRI25_15205 [Deltaproteobacteria bacterium]|nr:hypothetical protein [Deltaproteobacteria bacterium]